MIFNRKRKIDLKKRRMTMIISILILFQIIILGIISDIDAEDSNDCIIFSNTFGGFDMEDGFSVQETSDGGYIIAGQTFSYGAGISDVWLVKTDRLGKKEWSEVYGGESYDRGEYAKETSDGGYIVLGSTRLGGTSNTDVWLIKTDNRGEMQWEHTYGGMGTDQGLYVQEDIDGGYLINAKFKSKGLVQIKTDNLGNLEWEKEIDINYTIFQQTNDGGYIVIDNVEDRIMLKKLDEVGNEKWNNTFYLDGYVKGEWDQDRGECVQETYDGGYIIVGTTWFIQKVKDNEGFSSEYKYTSDIWLIKANITGDFEWMKIYGDYKGDYGYFVQQTNDGGYIVVGSSYSYRSDGRSDILLIKTDSLGNTRLPTIKQKSAGFDYWNNGKLLFSISLFIIIGIIYLYDRKKESKNNKTSINDQITK